MASIFESDDWIENIHNEMFKPKVPQDLAIDLVRRFYGLEVTEIKDMVSFNDQNFYIQISKEHQNPYLEEASDQGYTLKIINTFKSAMKGHFDDMHAAIKRLHERGLRVPLPVKNLEGKTWQLETVPLIDKGNKSASEKKCGIHLLTYIPGVTVATIENTADNFFECGLLLAKFHNGLEDLDCPNLKSKPILSSLKYFPFMSKFIETIGEGMDEEVKKLVLKVLDRFPSEIAENITNLKEGFIHGDFNDHNILAQVMNTGIDEKIYTVDGILDFEDIHYGSYLWDLGLMLGHVILVSGSVDPWEAAGHAIAGYRSLRSLNELEMSLLKMCIECRVCMLSLISSIAHEDPSNSYILMLSALEPKKRMLEQLSKTNNDDLLNKWEAVRHKRISDSK